MENLFYFMLLLSSVAISQPNDNFQANFYDIVSDFNLSPKNNPLIKGNGFKVFRRWEDYASSRVYPSGNLLYAGHLTAVEEFQKLYSLDLLGKSSATRSTNGNWEAVGPFGNPTKGDAGRVSFLRIHPTDSMILYAGTPNGGLWKSTNGASSWTCLTDNLAVIGCADLVIDYTNPNILYLATGDPTSTDCYSIGVLKSIDGGETWTETGFSRSASATFIIRKMIMHPTNNLEILIGTNDGVYKTIDGGESWIQALNGEKIKDMAYKPGSPSTVYAASNEKFYLNDGAGFTHITNGLPPADSVNKYAIGVSVADPNYVYLIASNGKNGPDQGGLLGVYLSTDGGNTFSLRANSPNILCQNQSGTGNGGQGDRNNCVLVSPFNKDFLLVGGISTWKSNDGGQSWILNTQADGMGAPEVHADAFEFVLPLNATDMSSYYILTDGGIYKKVGSNFNRKNGAMNIAQIYRLGVSSHLDRLITGHQDNGSYIKKLNGEFERTSGNDGMDCLISYHHDSVSISSSQYGNFHFSKDSGQTVNNLQQGLPSSNGRWVSPIIQNPLNFHVLYCGGWPTPQRMNNFLAGNDWQPCSPSPLNGDEDILAIEVAYTDTATIYAITENSIHKTDSSGFSWQNISGGSMPFAGSNLSDIAVSKENKDIAVVCFSSFNAPDEKVFGTLNGGDTWANLTKTGLPNMPYNTIAIRQNGTLNELYLGGDVGVYYTNDTMSEWILFSVGLPNTSIMDLEVSEINSGIYAATYGRSVWKSDFYSVNSANLSEQKKDESSVLLYPNPSKNKFTLELPSQTNQVKQIHLKSMTGSNVKIKYNKISANVYEINILENLNGIFFVEIELENNVFLKKEIILTN